MASYLEKKVTYIVTLPDGTIATRKTDRVYTHAVAEFASWRVEPCWIVTGFCGAKHFAEKKVATAQRQGWKAVAIAVEIQGAKELTPAEDEQATKNWNKFFNPGKAETNKVKTIIVKDPKTIALAQMAAAPKRIKQPSEAMMEKWVTEGWCKATDGCHVEPDGVCPHGKNSWLVELGIL